MLVFFFIRDIVCRRGFRRGRSRRAPTLKKKKKEKEREREREEEERREEARRKRYVQ